MQQGLIVVDNKLFQVKHNIWGEWCEIVDKRSFSFILYWMPVFAKLGESVNVYNNEWNCGIHMAIYRCHLNGIRWISLIYPFVICVPSKSTNMSRHPSWKLATPCELELLISYQDQSTHSQHDWFGCHIVQHEINPYVIPWYIGKYFVYLRWQINKTGERDINLNDVATSIPKRM